MSGSKVLVVLQTSTNTWALPKGHLERGESEIDAARREILEETGLAGLRLICSLGTYSRRSKRDPNVKKTIRMYLFSCGDAICIPHATDVSHCRWVSIGDVPTILSYEADIEFYRRHEKTIQNLVAESGN